MNSNVRNKFLKRITMKNEVLLDANILLRHLTQDDKNMGKTAIALLKSIATKKPRSTIYDTCQKMLYKNLLSRVEGYKTTKYEINSLNSIERNIEKAKLEIESKEEDFTNLKKLLKDSPKNISDVNVKFYDGDTGIEQMLYNILWESAKPILDIT